MKPPQEGTDKKDGVIVRITRRGVTIALASVFGFALAAAILFPVFAQARVGGKPNPPLWVAEAIQASNFARHRWPVTEGEVRPFLRIVPRRFDFDIRLQGYEGQKAVYEVTTDRRTVRFRIPPVDAPRPEAVL